MLLLLAISLPTYADTAAESSQRGRHLFFKGEKSNAEPLTANVGAASIPVPATALPCVGCHGRDGLGRPEGGVRPSDITWFNLTKEYGGSTLLGRRYKSYDESSFLTAVTEGIDSAGNKLDSSMPRYNISRRDARDLIAYLQVIQNDFDPGVSSDAIVFATVQPTVSAQAQVGDAMVEVLRARFDEVNRQGGVYGKQLTLEVLPFEDRQSFIGQANRIVGGDQVFALVSAFSGNADDSLVDLVEAAEIPSIAPYTQFPAAADGRHLYTFYLHGGLDAQIAVLAKRVGEQAKTLGKAFVFYRWEGRYESSANKALEFLQENKITGSQLVPYEGGPTQRLADLVDLQAYPDSAVLFLGSSRDLVELFSDPSPGQQSPQLFLPGFFVDSHILKLADVYAKRLEMAYVTVPGGNEGNGLMKFRQFMRRNELDHDFLSARLFAFSAAETLIEGVKRSGKRITRTKFVDAIEEMYAFDAGLNRPISYGSQRRTGLRGAYVVKFDTRQKRLSSTGTWIRLD